MPANTLLRELTRQRHLRYESFRTLYRQAASQVAPDDVPPSKAQYYRWLNGDIKGGIPYPDACRVLETMFPPWTAGDLFRPSAGGTQPVSAPGALLESVPGSFPASALEGAWATAYEFTHAGQPHYHADVAHIVAESDRIVRAVNWPPEPRTQGRARGFRNEIEATLFGRHLIGAWRNTSDARYFGSVHLAAQPGETIMTGWYTGLASDIAVSHAEWRWVRLADEIDPGVTLLPPKAVYDLLNSHSPDDKPLSPDEVTDREESE